MDHSTFLENLDERADPPKAVGEMRELIVLLCVRGKVSQRCGFESCTSFAKPRSHTFDSQLEPQLAAFDGSHEKVLASAAAELSAATATYA